MFTGITEQVVRVIRETFKMRNIILRVTESV